MHQEHSTIHIRTVSSQLRLCKQWYIGFLPGQSGAETKCTVHVALSKWPISQYKLDHQSRKKVLRAYIPNIYTVTRRHGGRDAVNQCTVPCQWYYCPVFMMLPKNFFSWTQLQGLETTQFVQYFDLLLICKRAELYSAACQPAVSSSKQVIALYVGTQYNAIKAVLRRSVLWPQ